MTATQPMSEKQLQAAIVELAQHLGYRVYHTFDSRRSQRGFPDLTMAKGRRLVFVELKRDDKRPTQDQLEWLSVLYDTGAEVYLWRPADWRDGTIEAVLRDPWAAA